MFLRALTSHPSQPLLTTYIFSKNEPLAEIFCETRQVTQVNHCFTTYIFQKLKLSQKIFARPDKSPKSTSNCNTYIFKNQISFSNKLAILSKSTKSTIDDDTYILKINSFRIFLREMASHPSQPANTTDMF